MCQNLVQSLAAEYAVASGHTKSRLFHISPFDLIVLALPVDFLECVDNGSQTNSDCFDCYVAGGPTSVTNTKEGQ